jgi:hypothetical protein
MTIFQALLTFVGGSAGLYLVTELVKRIPQIPIGTGMPTALRATVTVLSAGVTLFSQYASTGTIVPTDAQNFLMMLLQTGAQAYAAHMIHKGNKALPIE